METMARTLDEILAEDVIDSRDLIERMEQLEADEDLSTDDEMVAELERIRGIESQVQPYAEDWSYGAQLVRDSYFTEYARELAEDIGAVPEGGSWPTYCIDWEWAARELKMDYTAVEIDSVTYWTR